MVQDAEDRAGATQIVTALVDVAAWLNTAKGDEGWLAALRFGVAGGLAQTQHRDLAEGLYRDLLSANPTHLWAWIGLIDLYLARGDAAAAVAAGHAALGHHPQVDLVRRKTAGAIEQAQGPVAAIAFLDPLGDPPQDADGLSFAISLFRAAQNVTGVDPLCDALLALRPDDALAHLARIEAHFARGDDTGACAAGSAALVYHPDHAEIRLRTGQAHLRLGEIAQAAALCEAVSEPSLAAEFAALQQAVSQALSDDLPPLDLVPVIPDEADLPWYRLLADVVQALDRGDLALADQIAARAIAAPWSRADHRAFAIEYALLRHGPRTALMRVREDPVPLRDPESAERLGRVLLGAGHAGLAARYLWFCLKRWPDDAALLQLICNALHHAGHPERITEILDHVDALHDPGMVLAHRLAATMATGDAQALAKLCDLTRAALPDNPPLTGLITAHLLCGELPAAEGYVRRLRTSDGPLENALIHRPRATWLGSLLNEARILAALPNDDRREADYGGWQSASFLAARKALRHLTEGLPDMPVAPATAHAAHPLPPIHLAWQGLDPSNPDHQQVIAAWAEAFGQPRIMPTGEEAATWFAAHHGRRGAQAYALARQPAQKADLLRYALLLDQGGLALGAPQWPSRDMGRWLSRAGPAMFVRDAVGAVTTDVMLAPAGHPVIATALEMAITACLGRESDHCWFKTGPGLLTRAVAHNLAALGPGRRQAQLIPAWALRRYLHPYGAIQGPFPT